MNEFKNLLPSLGVVGNSSFSPLSFRDDVCSVGRIQQAAPSCVGCIECITCVTDRNDELRSGNLRNLGIDAGCCDFKIRTLRDEIIDRTEKFLVSLRIMRFPHSVQMPIIDLLLDPVAFFEEFTIAWSQVVQDLGEGIPEILGIQPESRYDFFTNKRFQCRVDG